MKTEPLITTGVIVALVAATIALLRAFGVPISEEQQEAIKALLVVLAPILVAIIARSYVTPLADPKVKLDSGRTVPLVRADTQQKP